MATKSNKINKKSGFTIIEVVLVLAIAGLIFLMVFIALPALQRSQRDTQRRQDYANLSAAITQFMTSNNNKLPATSARLDPATYINKDGNDPNGIKYNIAVCKLTSAAAASCDKSSDGTSYSAVADVAGMTSKISGSTAVPGLVFVVESSDCSGTNDAGYAVPTYNTATRAFSIYGYLETGTYCQSSTN